MSTQPDQEPADPAAAYRLTSHGVVWIRLAGDGSAIEQPLSNFEASIIADVLVENGIETRREFELAAKVGERTLLFRVPADRFDSLSWVAQHLGAGALVYPGRLIREHLTFAVKATSHPDERRVFAHTGWTRIDDRNVFLHAVGAIGPDGVVPNIEVELPPELKPFVLPPPPAGDLLREVVRESLGLLDLAPLRITCPLLASAYRAVLGGVDFSIFIEGETGVFKTTLAALFQQHFGAGFTVQALPGAWSGSANSLEELAFIAKDALIILDDFVPTSAGDGQNDHRKADRVLRAAGNNSGRLRCHSDGRLRAAHPPRGLLMSTGEDVPKGHSLRARTVVVSIKKGEIDVSALTKAQDLADRGRFAVAMSGFLSWVAAKRAQTGWDIKAQMTSLLDQFADSKLHKRTPRAIASLAAGLACFLSFAVECGAIDDQMHDSIWAKSLDALRALGAAQADHHQDAEPAAHFLTLLSSAIVSGSAHLESVNGDMPAQAARFGWRGRDPSGKCVGWVDEQGVYLDPTAAYAVAQELGRAGRDEIPVSLPTLRRRLHERGYLKTGNRGTERRLTVRKAIQGVRREVLHIAVHSLLSTEPDQPDLPSCMPAAAGAAVGPAGGPVAAESAPPDHLPDQRKANNDGTSGVDGPVGPVPDQVDPEVLVRAFDNGLRQDESEGGP